MNNQTQLQSLNLYQLGNEHQKLLSQLYDPETGEVNEEVNAQLALLSPTIEKKCISVASWIKNLEAEKAEIAFYKAEILKREQAYNKQIEQNSSYLKREMERNGISEIKCPFFTLKIKANPYSTDVFDETQLPTEFMKTREIVKVETKPDKNAIKEKVLATGIQVPGARVEQITQLKILTDKI